MIQVGLMATGLTVHAQAWPSNIKRLYIKGDHSFEIALHEKGKKYNDLNFKKYSPGEEIEINIDRYDAAVLKGKYENIIIDKNAVHRGDGTRWWEYSGWDIWLDGDAFQSDLHHYQD